jgi:hypothetical protein
MGFCQYDGPLDKAGEACRPIRWLPRLLPGRSHTIARNPSSRVAEGFKIPERSSLKYRSSRFWSCCPRDRAQRENSTISLPLTVDNELVLLDARFTSKKRSMAWCIRLAERLVKQVWFHESFFTVSRSYVPGDDDRVCRD